ncbi:MAG: preprotein translocase subunit YajC [Clostridia bacterium]|nr:preprotein translocase subunit YajC [Clostridia bacterium]
MMSMLLETGQNNVWNYVLIGVVALLLIAMPIMMNARNKKESQKVQEQTNSLKVGDKVLTTSGVYGTITEIKFDDARKAVVLETGGKVKSYLTVDAYAIYTVFKSDAELQREAEAKAAAEQKKLEEETAAKEAKKNKKAKVPVEEKPVEVVEAKEEAEAKVEEKSEENK